MSSSYSQIFQMLVSHIPTIVATAVLVVAAFMKLGRERGSGLFLTGAVGMLLMNLANPVIYGFIIPSITRSVESSRMATLYTVIGGLTSLCWAVCIGLVAVGTFMRPALDRPLTESDEPYPLR